MSDMNEDNKRESKLFVTSVERAFRIIDIFQNQDNNLSLSEITALSGYNRSAAQRFVYTLCTLGYMSQDQQSKRYRLTPKCLNVGYLYLHNEPFIEKSTPYLIDCHNRCKETVNMVKLLKSDIIYVTRFLSRYLASVDLVLGTKIPAYCTAPGRTILAYLPSQEVENILSNTNLVKYTRYTVNDPKEIYRSLEKIRENGFEIQNQEFILGDISVAAPVFNGSGKPVAAINIAVPLSRWTVEKVRKELAPHAMETAKAISNTSNLPANGSVYPKLQTI